MRRAAFICDDSLWAGGHPKGHPLRPERMRDTWDMLQAYNAFEADHVQVVPPRMVTQKELRTYHSLNYVDAVQRLSKGEWGIDEARYGFNLGGDNPVFKGMYDSEGLKVGASLVGAELLLNNEVDSVFNMSGGLHHAGRDFASGFCVFADGVIAIKRLLQADLRVAYIDIDAHHGDGVQMAFYDDNRVLTISIHESGHFIYPGTGFTRELGIGEGTNYSINLPLIPYADDEIYLWAFDQIVPPLVERFKPDVLVTELGVDTHWLDPLTHLSLSTQGQEALYQRLHNFRLPWLAVGGGGYNRQVVPRSWSMVWRVMSEQPLPDALPPAIAAKYDSPTLPDQHLANISDEIREKTKEGAELVVNKLRKVLNL